MSFHWQLRTQTVPSATTTSTAASAALSTTAANVSRRPVLSVRRRIINTPTAAVDSTTEIAEFTTTSKYNRLRSKPDSAITTTATTSKGGYSNSYLSKLKSSSTSAATLPLATLSPATSGASNINSSGDNTQKLHKFQAASYALRRQFQTRRLTTTTVSPNGDESATDAPRTQNPLFKRRLTLTSTAPPPRTTTLSLETTTFVYGSEDDDDQVAKSSIHTSRFNQISEQLRSRPSVETTSTSTTSTTTSPRPPTFLTNSSRRQTVPRPRRPQSATPTAETVAAAPPLARRQQSRRRPHKYIEVYIRPPSKTDISTATASTNRRNDNHEAATGARAAKRRPAKQSRPASTKVIVHGPGIIECLEQGNFPHPLSCRKFISCAKFDGTGGIVGWEYTCPKGLGYDGDSGTCSRTVASEGRTCRD